MGRITKPKYEIDYMLDKIYEYTETTELPILKEVCYLNNWNYDYVKQMEARDENLSHSIKRLLNKKEVELEKGGLCGKYNKTMAVFSLKQLGWRDSIEINNNEMMDKKLAGIVKKLEKIKEQENEEEDK